MHTINSHSSAALLAETHRMAVLLADRYVAEVLRGHGTPELDGFGRTWYDSRVLLCGDEFGPATRDIHVCVLAYGRYRGLVGQHPHRPHLVRLTREA